MSSDNPERLPGQTARAPLWVTILLGGSTLGAIVATIVVAAIKEAEALATVALALAVVAFLLQISFFVVQMLTNAVANRQFHELQGQTRDLLRDIRNTADTTQTDIRDMFGRVLDNLMFMTNAELSQSASTGDSEEDARQPEARLQDLMDMMVETRSMFEADNPSSTPYGAQVRALRDWPSARGMRRLAEEGLRDLSHQAADRLAEFASNLLDSFQGAGPDGLYYEKDDPGIRELVAQGVISPLGSPDETGRTFFRLAGNKGRGAARLITASAPMPSGATELFPWLRHVRD